MGVDVRHVEAVLRAVEHTEKLIAIVGPTASGKSDLALAVAERAGGEIVSADSVQVVRGFDIGSGKPTADERARVRHHLIDILDGHDAMDAADYARRAEAAIADIRARGRVPILCGGTFFWVRAFVLGLVEAPKGDPDVRARHRAKVEAEGRQALHDELARFDPASATRLHPNDVVRVSRALEVFELSGRPMSDWHADHGFKSQRHPTSMFGLAYEPAALRARIARRVDGFLARGWIEEVRDLVDQGYRNARAMGSVGYAEVRDHLDGKLAREHLAGAIVQSTHVFARRQRTWLKNAGVEWLPGAER